LSVVIFAAFSVCWAILDQAGPLEAIELESNPVDGIVVNSFPVDLAINPVTDRLYVTNQFSHTVSVVDTETDQVVDTIPVGLVPYGIGIDPIANRIYVTNIDSDTVSVIDGATDKVVGEIGSVSNPVGVTVNSLRSMVYVTNFDENTISMIDTVKGTVTKNVTVGISPFDIGVYRLDRNNDFLYVTNSLSNTVSVIHSNSTTDVVIRNITVGKFPVGVGVDQDRDIVYVTNKNSHSLTLINATRNEVIKTVPVGNLPVGVAVDQTTHVVYVSNTFDNTVSVISPSSEEVVKNIRVNPNNPDIERPLPSIVRFPTVASFIAIDQTSNLTYVSNTHSNKISIINSSSNDLVVGVTIKIEPEDLGGIVCDGHELRNDQYVRFAAGQKVKCEAIAESMFPPTNYGYWSVFPPILFDYWSGNQNPDRSNNHVTTFTMERFGTLSANFEEIPDLFQILGVTFAILTSIAAVLYGRREWLYRRRYVTRYTKKIESAYEIADQNRDEGLEILSQIRQVSRELFIGGKINMVDYRMLDNKISEYVNKIRASES
jgi:YVTN family beta-propeller protein